MPRTIDVRTGAEIPAEQCPKSKDPEGFHHYVARFFTIETDPGFEYQEATCFYCGKKGPLERYPEANEE